MKGKQTIIVLILFFASFFSIKAQQKYNLKIIYNEKPSVGSFITKHKDALLDSVSASLFLKNYRQELQNNGYLAASLDSTYVTKDTIQGYFSVGRKYKWINLKKGNISTALLNQIAFKEKFYSNKLFSIREFQKIQEGLIVQSENKGNPFASIRLDSLTIDSAARISASLNLTSGPLISFDTLSIVGSSKIKPTFLARYFRMEKGKVFNRSKITEAERFLGQFPSISIVSPADVVYSNYKAYPIFFLNHRPSNIIDGIIGFLPNESVGKKLLITGQFNLQLNNIGGNGKNLMVEWNKLKPLSQILNFQFTNLNLLRTGLDGDVKFNLLKEDTSFINLTSKITLSKILSKNFGTINFSTQYKNSRLSGTPTIEMAKNPEAVDFTLISYGVGYHWQKLDDVVFPRQGIKSIIEAQVGNKNIRRNADLDSSFYTNLSTNNLQASISAGVQLHKKISSKSGFTGSLSGGTILGKQIFINDLFRIGGIKTLRGFNENYFFASKYIISTVEYRYFFETESYFLLFHDQSYLKSEYGKYVTEDFPSGIGGGLSLKTNAGILQVIYSIGRSKDSPFDFNLSKIHFGIINRF